MVWSAALDYECRRNPYPEHRFDILEWRALATRLVMADQTVVDYAKQLEEQGMGRYDALHVASALTGCAELFVTTDDRLLKKIRKLEIITACLPAEALALMENWYEN